MSSMVVEPATQESSPLGTCLGACPHTPQDHASAPHPQVAASSTRDEMSSKPAHSAPDLVRGPASGSRGPDDDAGTTVEDTASTTRPSAEAAARRSSPTAVGRLSFQASSHPSTASRGIGTSTRSSGRSQSDELAHLEIARPPIGIVDTLRRKRFLSAEGPRYADRTDRVVKVTLPSPSLSQTSRIQDR